MDAAEVGVVLQQLLDRIVAHRRVPAPGPLTERPAGTVLARHLLERLRAEALDAWDTARTPPPLSDVLLTLRAMEAVRAELEPNWADHFASRLSGPGALDLVVEIAHDLRSPLTSILFLAETLQRGQSGDVNDLQRRQLGLIYGAALGLSSVTSDVMELARGGDRLVDKEPGPFAVAEILDSVRDIVRPIAEEKGLDVTVDPPPSDHRIGHAMALSRVLLNLTTNALKFTDQGTVEVTATPKERNRIEFSVQDTGRGIGSDALESLYQPFRRTRARREYCFSGTGLGLTICKKLVEAMGSTLMLDTSPERGTRFFFEVELPPAGEL
ncbi:MAG TPA: HAMP domain-containing sensor histidine kinase [Gemmatimonadales bacterium]|nr:HAMP domain-containing sensor histidine kinase [Gemmatimonadales bacterium]